MNSRTRTQRPGKHRQSGFNLIEVMVALGILAFGILAIASMQESSLLTSSRAYNITDGTSVAMRQMETLVAMAYTDPALNNTGGPNNWIAANPATQGRFTVNYSVTVGPAGGLPSGCKMISVQVLWNEAGGAQKSTVLTCTKERI